ncbi:MBL fold metallo-hydrolase [Oleomonas cavernae]|nr:MBL fold metallo-hydrolase [Oleomonas cavernae]
MKILRRLLFVLVGLAVVVTGIYLVWGNQIMLMVAERVARANFAADRGAELPDGLHLVVCGAAGPMPDAVRSGPCMLVVAGKHSFMVDAGTNGARNLTRMGFRLGGLDAVLLTHFHSDHIDGLGETLMLRWATAAHQQPTPVYGPPGVERVVAGFNEAYALDATYRTAHHGATLVPPEGNGGTAMPFAAPQGDQGVVVYEQDGVKITAFHVDHSPIEPAVGYRFDYGGRSLVISGDTKANPNVEKFSKGVDLLAHEALARNLIMTMSDAAAAAGRANFAQIMKDILTYHTSPAEAAAIAQRAGVRYLLFVHIVPPLPTPLLHGLFLEGVSDAYNGPAAIARDGTMISLPKGSDAIDTDSLM